MTTKNDMQAMIEKLSYNQVFGCYTRQALDLRWDEFTKNAQAIIFLDIDNMHGLNEQYGYAGVDERINKSLAGCRKSDIITVGQHYSGDEFCIIINNNESEGCAKRIQQNFNNNGLSVTIAIVTDIKNNLTETCKPAANKVQSAKKNNQRGTINL